MSFNMRTLHLLVFDKLFIVSNMIKTYFVHIQQNRKQSEHARFAFADIDLHCLVSTIFVGEMVGVKCACAIYKG